MSKVAVVFWSGTGNTQAMADAVRRLFTQSVSGMYENAQDKFVRLYNPEANYACLAEIYNKISKK
jgi:flavodoxin